MWQVQSVALWVILVNKTKSELKQTGPRSVLNFSWELKKSASSVSFFLENLFLVCWDHWGEPGEHLMLGSNWPLARVELVWAFLPLRVREQLLNAWVLDKCHSFLEDLRYRKSKGRQMMGEKTRTKRLAETKERGEEGKRQREGRQQERVSCHMPTLVSRSFQYFLCHLLLCLPTSLLGLHKYAVYGSLSIYICLFGYSVSPTNHYLYLSHTLFFTHTHTHPRAHTHLYVAACFGTAKCPSGELIKLLV
jgi:hypothetical protein